MKKFGVRFLCLAVAIGAGMAMPVEANAAAKPKVAKTKAAKAKKPSKAQQEEAARRAAQAKAEEEARAEAARRAEEQARAEAEARARAAAEEKARAEAEAKAKREAELAEKEKPLKEAEALMAAGKPAEAYALLEPLDFERSGEMRFDYLIGIAALDSGKPDKATLAFERVLAVNPNHGGARLDMARALFQLGDMGRAQAEFDKVLKLNPPEAAKATIQKYLDAIAAQEQAKQLQVSGYMEGSFGYDSNVNTGTGASIPMVSLIPGWPSPTQQIEPTRRSNSYYTLAEGGELNRVLNDNWRLFAGGDLRARKNNTRELQVYDSAGFSVRGGVGYGIENNSWSLTLNGGQTFTGRTMRTDSLGLNADWQHTFSPSNQMSMFAMYVQNRASGYQATGSKTDIGTLRDARVEGNVDQVMLGGGWMHVGADGKSVMFTTLAVGNELDVAPALGQFKRTDQGVPYVSNGRPDGKKFFGMLRVGSQKSFNDELEGVVSLGWTHANYSAVNFFIANNGKRREDQYDLTLGASWHWDKLWTLKPQLAFTSKKSNLALYRFDRVDASLALRRDFR